MLALGIQAPLATSGNPMEGNVLLCQVRALPGQGLIARSMRTGCEKSEELALWAHGYPSGCVINRCHHYYKFRKFVMVIGLDMTIVAHS